MSYRVSEWIRYPYYGYLLGRSLGRSRPVAVIFALAALAGFVWCWLEREVAEW